MSVCVCVCECVCVVKESIAYSQGSCYSDDWKIVFGNHVAHTHCTT